MMIKTNIQKINFLLGGILSIVVAGVGQPAITVINKANVKRSNELIVCKKAFLQRKLGSALSAGKLVQVSFQGKPVVVQYDDLNGDGKWDELAFLYSFQPLEKVIFKILVADTTAISTATVRAYVRQRHKLPNETFAPSVLRDTMPYNQLNTDFSKEKLPWVLTEGPAWENDKVGFRKYFDIRNANDVWGKVTPRMILDEVGVDPAKIYHHFDSSWGMDILKVGKSLGAGGLALLVRINGKDTVVRFGKNVELETYEQVANGPIRAIFRIHYHNWKIGLLAQPIQATEEISIWGGQYFYQNKISVKDAPVNSCLVTGIIDFYIPVYDSLQNKKIAGIYTWGRQSENADQLGMALLAPVSNYLGAAHLMTGDVSNAFIIKQKLGANQPLLHRVYAAWEKTDARFSSSKEYQLWLQQEASKMGSALQIQ